MSIRPLFSRVADRWQKQIENQREYDVIRDGNVFKTSLCDSYLFQSDHNRANSLKLQLLRDNEGREIEEIFSGEEIDTPAGPCYAIRSVELLPISDCESSIVLQEIESDLKLVYGIGEFTEQMLKRRGFQTIADLLSHPKFREGARIVLELIENGTPLELMEWMLRWYPASHPSILKTSLLYKKENFIFFDIETMGLFSRPIILFGIGIPEYDHLTIHQYLLRDVNEEEAALSATFELFTGRNPAFITFNGRAFDIPYLRDRAAYYGLPRLPKFPHYDILHYSRRKWRKFLPDCRLQTLEQHICNTGRGPDVPSAMVPEFFDTYLQTGNPGPLIPIVEHNRCDVSTLARLYAVLREELNVRS